MDSVKSTFNKFENEKSIELFNEVDFFEDIKEKYERYCEEYDKLNGNK